MSNAKLAATFHGLTRREWRRRVWALRNSVPYRIAVLLGLVISPSHGPRPPRRRTPWISTDQAPTYSRLDKLDGLGR